MGLPESSSSTTTLTLTTTTTTTAGATTIIKTQPSFFLPLLPPPPHRIVPPKPPPRDPTIFTFTANKTITMGPRTPSRPTLIVGTGGGEEAETPTLASTRPRRSNDVYKKSYVPFPFDLDDMLGSQKKEDQDGIGNADKEGKESTESETEEDEKLELQLGEGNGSPVKRDDGFSLRGRGGRARRARGGLMMGMGMGRVRSVREDVVGDVVDGVLGTDAAEEEKQGGKEQKKKVKTKKVDSWRIRGTDEDDTDDILSSRASSPDAIDSGVMSDVEFEEEIGKNKKMKENKKRDVFQDDDLDFGSPSPPASPLLRPQKLNTNRRLSFATPSGSITTPTTKSAFLSNAATNSPSSTTASVSKKRRLSTNSTHSANASPSKSLFVPTSSIISSLVPSIIVSLAGHPDTTFAIPLDLVQTPESLEKEIMEMFPPSPGYNYLKMRTKHGGHGIRFSWWGERYLKDGFEVVVEWGWDYTSKEKSGEGDVPGGSKGGDEGWWKVEGAEEAARKRKETELVSVGVQTEEVDVDETKCKVCGSAKVDVSTTTNTPAEEKKTPNIIDDVLDSDIDLETELLPLTSFISSPKPKSNASNTAAPAAAPEKSGRKKSVLTPASTNTETSETSATAASTSATSPQKQPPKAPKAPSRSKFTATAPEGTPTLNRWFHPSPTKKDSTHAPTTPAHTPTIRKWSPSMQLTPHSSDPNNSSSNHKKTPHKKKQSTSTKMHDGLDREYVYGKHGDSSDTDHGAGGKKPRSAKAEKGSRKSDAGNTTPSWIKSTKKTKPSRPAEGDLYGASVAKKLKVDHLGQKQKAVVKEEVMVVMVEEID